MGLNRNIKAVILSVALLMVSRPAISSPTPTNSINMRVSTINLKWFGIGGAMWNLPDQEFRSDNIKRLIEQELRSSDVIVFTEVVVTETLKTIVSDKMDCATYQGAWDRHQHIVICYTKSKYRAEKYDEDFIIDSVDLGSGGLRPAAQAKICHKTGKCFLQVIGVHLAAGQKSAKRAEQVSLIADNLKKQKKILPTVITGDFNSYIKEQSGEEEDDINVFERLLSTSSKRFESITSHITTYNSGEFARAYDHIITSHDIKTLSTWGYEACKKAPNYQKIFIPYNSFRKYFTDHCPVTAKIAIPKP